MTARATMVSYADRAGRAAAITLGFSIPISVALDSVLLAFIALAWLAGGSYREKLAAIRDNPVALGALGLFALLALGTAYGVRDAGDGALYLGKYLDLVFLPVFAWLLREPGARHLALRALAVSLALVLLLSYLVNTGLIPKGGLILGDRDNPVVFKQYLTHNILMAFGAFLFAYLAREALSRSARWTWAALAVLSAGNVVLLMQGRTGYVVLGALLLYMGYASLRWRGLIAALAALALATVVLAAAPGPFKERLASMRSEIRDWHPGAPAGSSVGLRLEFYRNSLAIIGDHPLFGVGTGGFPRAYADNVRGTGIAEARNPHNEYLHIAVQIGLVGLVALLSLFYLHWRHAPQLATPFEYHLARALVLTIAVGSLFNSLLLDHTEGLLYAWLTGLLYGGLQSRSDSVIK